VTQKGRQLGGSDDVRRVKDACDIVRIIGDHVALKPKGREFVGLCPFHQDSKPSMTVVPSKQIFHCFACGTGGDVLGFVQKFLRMEFREALEYLADRSGVTLTPRNAQRANLPPGAPAPTSRADLLRACATATAFFRAILNHPEHGTAARHILASRGVSDAMIDSFHLGASPDRWDGLLKTIQSKGLDPRPFIDAGLLKPRDDGSAYDALRNRIIFPIHDPAGRVVAFGGRKIDPEDEPKYLNSPETRLFNKSATLFALFQASRPIQASQRALITEGYMDAIACHQGGFTNAVATLGTSLTRDHATILRRLCHTVILLFDGDSAGQRATDRAAEIFFAEPIDVRIATLADHTDAKDPDELLKRPDGAQVFSRVLDNATDLLDYRFARLRAKLAGQGGAALARAVDDELAALVQLGLARVSPIRHRLIVRKLAQLSGLDEATILRAVPVGRAGPAWSAPQASPSPFDTSDADDADASDAYDATGSAPGLTSGPSPEARRAAAARATEARVEATRLTSRPLDAHEHLMACLLCEGDLYTTLDAPSRDLLAPDAFASPVLRVLARVVDAIAEREQGPTTPHLTNVLDALARPEDHEGDLLAPESPALDAAFLEAARAAAVALATRVHTLTGGDPAALHANWRSTLARASLERDQRRIRATSSPSTSPTTPTTPTSPRPAPHDPDATTSTTPVPPPPNPTRLDPLRIIELKRTLEARRKAGELEPDRRVLPKPRT
jgi:DNA primase